MDCDLYDARRVPCDVPEGVGALTDVALGVEEDGGCEGAVLREEGGG